MSFPISLIKKKKLEKLELLEDLNICQGFEEFMSLYSVIYC